jgi:hypothetical protein
MKKAIAALSFVLLITSCDNSGTTKEATDTTGVHRPAVENVNGNMPETTNSISLDTRDTTVTKDTSNR